MHPKRPVRAQPEEVSGLPSKFETLLLVALLLEILLGGNGYLTQVGGIRVRVLLSAVCIAWVAVRLLSSQTERLPHQIWCLFFLFMGVTSLGILVGISNGNGMDLIANELKPLLYFPLILFFAHAIRNQADVERVTRLIVVCGVVQAFAYLAVMAAVHSGAVSYSTVYLFLRESDEFIFRHNPEEEFFLGFFYKGAFHLSVAALFLLLHPVWKNKWLALIVLTAIGLTLTRGLTAALILSLVAGVFLMPRKRWVAVLLFLGGLAGSVFLLADPLVYLQRSVSDEIRLADLHTILSELDPSMLLFGKGIGALIGERPRIEMNYLEVLYKQGIIGLLPWGALLLVNFLAFQRVRGSLRQQALVFHLAALFVYFATATNTFLTGSIGMSIVLISTVVLLVMDKTQVLEEPGPKGFACTSDPVLGTRQCT